MAAAFSNTYFLQYLFYYLDKGLSRRNAKMRCEYILLIFIKRDGIFILPVFVGWFLFQEHKKMQRKEYIAFGIGILGIVFIILR